MEVVVTAGGIRRAMLQSKCHHQQTNAHDWRLASRIPATAFSNDFAEGNVHLLSWDALWLLEKFGCSREYSIMYSPVRALEL